MQGLWNDADARGEREMTRLEISNLKSLLDVRICDLDRAIKDKEDELEFGDGITQTECHGSFGGRVCRTKVFTRAGEALAIELAELKVQLATLEDERDALDEVEPEDDLPPVPPTHSGAIFGRLQPRAMAARAGAGK